MGDRVVVRFLNKDFNDPVVVGFESHPKPCGEYLVGIWGVYHPPMTGNYKKAAFIWDIEQNCLATGLGFDNPIDATDPDYVAWITARTNLTRDDFFDDHEYFTCYSTTITPSIPFPPEHWIYETYPGSRMNLILPSGRQPILYQGSEEGGEVFDHEDPCRLALTLDSEPTQDGYVRAYHSRAVPPSLERIDSITNHFSINSYSLQTGFPGDEMLRSELHTRTGSPDRYWYQRVSVEELYNTDFNEGTFDKWHERYYCPLGLLGTFDGRRDLKYTRMGDLSITWGKYESTYKDWLPYGPGTPYFFHWRRNTDKSLVLICMQRYVSATETYSYETEHMSGGVLIPRVDTPKEYVYHGRELRVLAAAVFAEDITTVDIPTVGNSQLSQAIKDTIALSYTLAGGVPENTLPDETHEFRIVR